MTESIQAETTSDFWAPAQLLERVPHLRQLAAEGDGSSGETLKKYPRHSTILSFRSRDGVSEVHESFADLFYILDGTTTLVTGGTIVGAKTVGPGEIRGISIEGGSRQELKAGDVAHVPAGLPHQMLVAPEESVTCMVIKVQEVV